MKSLFTTGLSLSILILLSSCQDHRGFPPQNERRTRLHREYSRLVNSSDSTYTGYTEFLYDGSGRIRGVDYYNRQSGGSFVKSSSNTLTYDAQGRLEKESINESLGTNYTTFFYDSVNRINKIETDAGPFGKTLMLLTYDALNRINGRTFNGYNADGRMSSTSIETFEFDDRNNIISRLQTYQGGGLSFRRRVDYTYDQGPNPLYQVPILNYLSIPFFNSPNNVIKEVIKETNSMAGPFEPLTYNETLNYRKTYQNGLLYESTDNTLARQYQYENY